MSQSKAYKLGEVKELSLFNSIQEALNSDENGILSRQSYTFKDICVPAAKINNADYDLNVAANIRALRGQDQFSEKFLVLNNVLQLGQHIFICGDQIYSNELSSSHGHTAGGGNCTQLLDKYFTVAEDTYIARVPLPDQSALQKKEEPVFCCLPTAGHLLNFGCWLTQVIPQFIACDTFKASLTFVVSNARDWHKKLLNEFFGDKLNLQFLDLSSITLYKKIIIPLGFSAFKLSGNTLEYFDVFFKRYEKPDSPKKIYISRKSHNLKLLQDPARQARNFINEKELADALQSRGLHIVEPEKLSYEEMFTYMYNATHVISPGGANIFNVVACKKGTKIIDIEIGGWGRHHAALFSSLDLDYSLYLGERTDSAYTGPQPNFKVDVESFLAFAAEAINVFNSVNVDDVTTNVAYAWKNLANNKFLPYAQLKQELDKFLPNHTYNNLTFNRQAALKLVLKTKNESALLEPWLLHHSNLVGWENIVVIDNQSDDKDTLAIYEKYKDKPFILLSYKEGSPNLLHDVELNAPLYKRLIGSSAKFVMMLDTDEFVTYFDVESQSFNFPVFLDKLNNIENRGKAFGSLWVHNSPSLSTLEKGDFNNIVDYELNPWNMRENVACGKCVVSTYSDVWNRKKANKIINLGHNSIIPGIKMLNGLWLMHLSKAFPEVRIKNNISMLKARNTCRTEENKEVNTITAEDIAKLETLLENPASAEEHKDLFSRLQKVNYHKLKEVVQYLQNKKKAIQKLATYNSHYTIKTNIIQRTIDSSIVPTDYACYNGREMSIGNAPYIIFREPKMFSRGTSIATERR